MSFSASYRTKGVLGSSIFLLRVSIVYCLLSGCCIESRCCQSPQGVGVQNSSDHYMRPPPSTLSTLLGFLLPVHSLIHLPALRQPYSA